MVWRIDSDLSIPIKCVYKHYGPIKTAATTTNPIDAFSLTSFYKNRTAQRACHIIALLHFPTWCASVVFSVMPRNHPLSYGPQDASL